MASTMPAQRNGPKAKWSFLSAFWRPAGTYRTRRRPGCRKTSPAGYFASPKQPGGCHQFDIAAAERTVNGKAEQKHRHADADCTDDMPPPPGGESAVPATPQIASAKFSRSGMVCVSASMSAMLKKNAADRQRQQRRPAHAEQSVGQTKGRAVLPGTPPAPARRPKLPPADTALEYVRRSGGTARAGTAS